MWKIADMNPDKSYFLRLCEHEDGRRYVLLVANDEEPGNTAGLDTETVPFELLRKRDNGRLVLSLGAF